MTKRQINTFGQGDETITVAELFGLLRRTNPSETLAKFKEASLELQVMETWAMLRRTESLERIATALERLAPPEGTDIGLVIAGAIADGMRDGAMHASEIAWTFMNNQRGG